MVQFCQECFRQATPVRRLQVPAMGDNLLFFLAIPFYLSTALECLGTLIGKIHNSNSMAFSLLCIHFFAFSLWPHHSKFASDTHVAYTITVLSSIYYLGLSDFSSFASAGLFLIIL